MTHRQPKQDMQIFSIFGQIEKVAAEMMIESDKARLIKFEDIPDTARYNEAGERAFFAVQIVGRGNLRDFEEKIKDLRA